MLFWPIDRVVLMTYTVYQTIKVVMSERGQDGERSSLAGSLVGHEAIKEGYRDWGLVGVSSCECETGQIGLRG